MPATIRSVDSSFFNCDADFQLSAPMPRWRLGNFPIPGSHRRGRAVAFNNVLVFGTAGLAYGDLRVNTRRPDGVARQLWLDRRRRGRGGLHAALVGKG